MPIDSILAIVPVFFEAVRDHKVEIYNEFSLQHELGCYLRASIPSPMKVQFERPVEFFQPRDATYEKKEIDLAIFRSDMSDRVAIELKFPRNGQYPEQMFSSCCDILFLEQLVDGGFVAGLFVIATDDPGFRQGRDQDGIYSYFRRGQSITGTLEKPTGSAKRIIKLHGQYAIQWRQVAGELHYSMVVVRRTC